MKTRDLIDERGAEISGPYRFRLWRHWGAGQRRLLWIMLNPSTADAEQDDATIRRCIAFSRRDGYDGLRVCNLFALRSTDPRRLRTATNPIGFGNDDTIRAEAAATADVIAAWGCLPAVFHQRADDVLQLLRADGHTVRCLGRTSQGFPCHPVRLHGATPFETFQPYGERP